MAAARSYWADDFVTKKRAADQAVACIRSGQRVFVGSFCAEPRHLLRAFWLTAKTLSDVEIVRLFGMESSPLALMANLSQDRLFNMRTFYMGSAASGGMERHKRFIAPVNLSEVPHLFKSRKLPIHVALVQTSPPDDFGWMSLGISVDVTLAAAQSADVLIVQINANMPRAYGQSFIHVNDADMIVEQDELLPTTSELPLSPFADGMGRYIADLIEDGSTLHMGLGLATQAGARALHQRNDLGIHTQYLTDAVMDLVSRGIVTNSCKRYHAGMSIASGAVGSRRLYAYIHENPSVALYPSDYVNDPAIISRHFRMVSINEATAIDLTGQASADAKPHNYYSGISGVMDFMCGAANSPEGKAILLLPATFDNGGGSRIVSRLDTLAVVVPRGDVHYVVTEYGAVNLFGKNLQERALALISITHPDHRENLLQEARALGLIRPGRA